MNSNAIPLTLADKRYLLGAVQCGRLDLTPFVKSIADNSANLTPYELEAEILRLEKMDLTDFAKWGKLYRRRALGLADDVFIIARLMLQGYKADEVKTPNAAATTDHRRTSLDEIIKEATAAAVRFQ